MSVLYHTCVGALPLEMRACVCVFKGCFNGLNLFLWGCVLSTFWLQDGLVLLVFLLYAETS